MESVDLSARLGPRRERTRHRDPVAVVEPKNASVEQLVVEHAQRQPVVEVVRAVESEPADVRRLQPDRDACDLAVVTAEGALPVPGVDDGHPPRRVPQARARRRDDGCLHHLGEADGGEDVVGDGGGELAVHEGASQAGDGGRGRQEVLLDVRDEGPGDPPPTKRPDRVHGDVTVELPDGVRPEPGERVRGALCRRCPDAGPNSAMSSASWVSATDHGTAEEPSTAVDRGRAAPAAACGATGCRRVGAVSGC